MTMSGCARTTNSGFSLGKGPSSAGMALPRPSVRSVSPMKESGPAAYKLESISKYTRCRRCAEVAFDGGPDLRVLAGQRQQLAERRQRPLDVGPVARLERDHPHPQR